MTPRGLVFKLLLCFSLGLWGAPAAWAAPSKAEELRAIGHYKKGRQLLARNHYEHALAELDRSLALMPSPNTELLRGHALYGLNRVHEAMESYERALDDAAIRVRRGEKRYQRTLQEAGRWRASLKAELGELSIVVTNAPEQTTLLVGGVPYELRSEGVSEALVAKVWHLPGSVSISARAPDEREEGRQVDVVAGQRMTVALRMPDLEPQAPAEVPEKPAPVPSEDDGGPPLGSWIAAGVGLAGMGMFIGFGIASSSTASDLDACAPHCPEDLRDDAEAGERNQTIANVALAVGATGIATAGIIWIASASGDDDAPDEDGDETVSLTLGPGHLGLVGRF